MLVGKDDTIRWDLASLTMKGRNVNNDVISGNDVIVYTSTIHCQ